VIAGALVLALVAAAATPSPPAKTPELMKAAAATYTVACAPCHGATGEGNGPVSFAIKPPPRNFRLDPFKAGDSLEQIYATITNGLPDTKMVGFPQLSDADRWGIAYFIHGLRPKK
jgi:high-affinity iron transporter